MWRGADLKSQFQCIKNETGKSRDKTPAKSKMGATASTAASSSASPPPRSSRPETVQDFAYTNSSIVERILGAVAIVCFVSTWISSLCSPALFAYSVWSGNRAAAAFILGATACSYAPWKQGRISNFVHRNTFYYFPRYFRSMSVEFEGKALPGADRQERQTFYAVHPHGAFSFGWSVLFGNPRLKHVRFCFAPALYFSPFFRLFSRAVGNPGSASKPAMVSYFKRGEHLALPPGGFVSQPPFLVLSSHLFSH